MLAHRSQPHHQHRRDVLQDVASARTFLAARHLVPDMRAQLIFQGKTSAVDPASTPTQRCSPRPTRSQRPIPNKPLHYRTRTRSFGLSRGLCSVSCMISVLCLAELLQCFSSHESCVTGCHSFHRIFGSTFLRTSGSRQVSSRNTIARQALVSSRKTHEFVGLFSTTHHKSIFAPRRRHCGAAAPSSYTAPL